MGREANRLSPATLRHSSVSLQRIMGKLVGMKRVGWGDGGDREKTEYQFIRDRKTGKTDDTLAEGKGEEVRDEVERRGKERGDMDAKSARGQGVI